MKLKKFVSWIVIILTVCQFSACDSIDTDSINTIWGEIIEEFNETEKNVSNNKNYDNDTRPQKNDFDKNTAQKVLSGDYVIPIPTYWDENTPNEEDMDYQGYAETGGKTAMLQIVSHIDTEDPATFEVLYDDKDNMVKAIKHTLNYLGSSEFINYDIYETEDLKGMFFNFNFVYDEFNLTGKATWFVFPSEKDNKWIYVSLSSSDNTYYRYDEDFMKMINAIKKNDNSSPTQNTKTSISYSTNDLETAKKGNTGVFSYKSRGGQYTIYCVIDFDEGYVYRFRNDEDTCERLKIDSGDLNNVLIVTYHDGDDSWQNGLHFKWKNQPDHLILEDNNHFETDFYSTNLSDALRIKDDKTIIDY